MAAESRSATARRWGILVVLTVLGAAAGLAYALIKAPDYSAKAYVAVVAENPGDTSAVSYAQAYSRIASQGDALQAAADASQGRASVQELRRSVLAAASPDAPVIELTGTAGSAERAADLVNLLANGLMKTANSHTGDTRMRVALLSAAVPPADPTSPQLPLAVALGAAVGLLLGGLAFLVRGERHEPPRPSGWEAEGRTGREPVDPPAAYDGTSDERAQNLKNLPPTTVMTPFSPLPERPPAEGGGARGPGTLE
jgi:capsular polysaccharide biosynthesis protein